MKKSENKKPYQSENYTLNRLYHEAKALLEKYGAHKEKHTLRVQFEIEDSDKTPTLEIHISYRPSDYNGPTAAFGYGATPYHALSIFEQTLRNATGKHLIEQVSVEIEGVEL